MFKYLTLFSLLLANIVHATTAEQQKASSPWQVHGFLSQGAIKASGSDFVNDDQKTSFELTEIGLNASYQVNNSMRLAGQLVYLNGGNRYAEGARLDYLLLDWSVYQSLDSQVNVYLGRFKNYNWLYSSIRDVPFTRPSIVLPQSLYFDGFRDIAVGGDGIAIAYKQSAGSFGELDFNLSFGTSSISDKQRAIILGEFANGEMDHDFDVQSSVYWQPAESQWRFGLALLDSDFGYKAGQHDLSQDADIVLQRFMLNALYEGERWELSGEAFQERFILDGFYHPNFHRDNKAQGFFVQTRYKWAEQLKVLARFEKFFANKDDKNGSELAKNPLTSMPNHFGFQHDITLGLAYDLASNMQIQMEHHWVEGTARLTPVVVPNVQINKNKHWQMWAVQFMYWF